MNIQTEVDFCKWRYDNSEQLKVLRDRMPRDVYGLVLTLLFAAYLESRQRVLERLS